MAQFKGSNHQYDLTQEDEVCTVCSYEYRPVSHKNVKYLSEQYGVKKKFSLLGCSYPKLMLSCMLCHHLTREFLNIFQDMEMHRSGPLEFT